MDFLKVTDWESETEKRVEEAMETFRKGYNCAQAVGIAFADCYGVPTNLMARMASSFGGGIGRMRETCGAACGMFLLAGLEVSNAQDTPDAQGADAVPYPDAEVKKKNYEVVQRLASDFRAETGSLLCRELLGLAPIGSTALPDTSLSPVPEARTQAYYQKRPCIRMVETAVRIYMNYLKEKYNKK